MRNYKNARLRKNLKVIEAAKLLGVSQSTLSSWEAERKSPPIEKLIRMADLYEVSTDYLLGYIAKTVNQPLTLKELTTNRTVWLEPISSDETLRQELRGYYCIMGNYAENQCGNRFPLFSYGAKWIAYENSPSAQAAKS